SGSISSSSGWSGSCCHGTPASGRRRAESSAGRRGRRRVGAASVVVESATRSGEGSNGMHIPRKALVLGIGVAIVAAACSSSGGGGSSNGPLTKVRFQLQWVAQAQFAGYYAAVDQGYYKDQGLDVQLILGGPDINPMQVVASDGAEIGT